MTSMQILRFALAAISTELESEDGCCQSAEIIATEALELTRRDARPGKDLRLDGMVGMGSWREFRRLNELHL